MRSLGPPQLIRAVKGKDLTLDVVPHIVTNHDHLLQGCGFGRGVVRHRDEELGAPRGICWSQGLPAPLPSCCVPLRQSRTKIACLSQALSSDGLWHKP